MNDEKIQKIREAFCFFICGATIVAMCVLTFLGWAQ